MTRLLVAIPHFFGASAVEGAADGAFRSRGIRRAERAAAFARCLAQLGGLFGDHHLELDHSTGRVGARIIRHRRHARVEVLIATHRDNHLLAEMALPPFARAIACDDEPPRHLGFACHGLLQAQAGEHDIYAFLEDDLVIHDADFLAKLGWFASQFGDAALLQPNRYEIGPEGTRIYVDGDLPAALPRPPAPAGERLLEAPHLGRLVRFERRSNLLSGCFFLSAAQLAAWIASPYAQDRDSSFLGPLESAQLLPLMKLFPVYKPSLPQAGFLAIEHADARLSTLPAPSALLASGAFQSDSSA